MQVVLALRIVTQQLIVQGRLLVGTMCGGQAQAARAPFQSGWDALYESTTA
jgi:hypothetical protein